MNLGGLTTGCEACRSTGWRGDGICDECGGVGKIMIPEHARKSRWQRVAAWIIFVAAIAFAFYKFVYGGR